MYQSSSNFSGYREKSKSSDETQTKQVIYVDMPTSQVNPSSKSQTQGEESNNSSTQRQTLMTQYTGPNSANLSQGRPAILLQQPNLPQINHLPQHIQQFYSGNVIYFF